MPRAVRSRGPAGTRRPSQAPTEIVDAAGGPGGVRAARPNLGPRSPASASRARTVPLVSIPSLRSKKAGHPGRSFREMGRDVRPPGGTKIAIVDCVVRGLLFAIGPKRCRLLDEPDVVAIPDDAEGKPLDMPVPTDAGGGQRRRLDWGLLAEGRGQYLHQADAGDLGPGFGRAAFTPLAEVA